MKNRLELHEMLCESLGSRNVYFQPPENVEIKYPAIIYSLAGITNEHANNSVYSQSHLYTVVVIDKNPDSEIMKKISKLPTCGFDRHYRIENLNHYVFTMFY